MEVLTETLIFIDYYLNQKFKKTKEATRNPSKLTVGGLELVGQHTGGSLPVDGKYNTAMLSPIRR